MSEPPVMTPTGAWPMATRISAPKFTFVTEEEPTSRLIVTIRKNPASDSALADIRNPSEFGCNFEGMLEDRLPGTESATILPTLDHRFAILTSPQGDEFPAANRILARHGGPNGSVIAVEPDVLLRFSMPSVGLPFHLGGQHNQYRSIMAVLTAYPSTTGGGVSVAVVDTGADLQGVTDFYDVLNSSGPHPGLPSHDNDGHGTAMVRLIQAVAPGARIFVVRVADQPYATVVDTMAGVSVAMVDCQADIINLSLGFPGFGTVCGLCGSSGTSRSIAFETILRSLSKIKSGIYVAAAGNDAPKQTEFEYPGAYDFSVVVGSVNSHGDRSRFSQYRAAGGHKRYAMAPGGETDASGNATEHVGTGSAHCFGTSVATAYFSGMLALFRAESRYQGLTPDKFINAVLTQHCVPHSTGNITEYGHGIIRYS